MVIRRFIPVFLILSIAVYAPLFRELGDPWPTLFEHFLDDTACFAGLVLNLLLVAWLYNWYMSRP